MLLEAEARGSLCSRPVWYTEQVSEQLGLDHIRVKLLEQRNPVSNKYKTQETEREEKERGREKGRTGRIRRGRGENSPDNPSCPFLETLVN